MPCHVPRQNRPLLMGTLTDDPISVALTWPGMSSSPSMVCSNVSPEAHGGVERAAEDFRLLGELVASRGMRVAFEALAWGRHISDYRDSWEVVRRTDHPAVGLVLDSFHICARKTDLRAIRSIPPP